MRPFRDRTEAGQVLAAALMEKPGVGGVSIVLGLPRGGVPVAAEVAKALNLPLDVFLVRKLGVPGHEELAMGAIASGDVRVMNDDVVGIVGASEGDIANAIDREGEEIQRQEALYRGNRAPLAIEGRLVILVDDGLATGASMRVAARAVRAQRPERLIIAAPVGSRQACEALQSEADEVVCSHIPRDFNAVGMWYEDFGQTTDDEVKRLLATR
jgi:predicted phosphoribosyltransferase